MKKILTLIAVTLLLTSCFGKKEAEVVVDDNGVKVDINEGNVNVSGEGVDVQIDEDGVSVDSEDTSLDIDKNGVNVETGDTSVDVEGDTEEVMQDFEKEINDLFNTIEDESK